MSEALQTQSHLAPPRTDIDAAWFIKRAIMAVLILSVGIGGGAWLLHASIKPTLEAKAAEISVNHQVMGPTGSIAGHQATLRNRRF